MFLTPYQTTACSATAGLPAIASALQRAAVHEDLPPAVTLKENVLEGVFLVPPYLKEIKPFSLPIDFDGPNGLAVAVDVRGITKQVGERQLKIVAGGGVRRRCPARRAHQGVDPGRLQRDASLE
ncbi:hypothetical protein [Xanthomonas phage RTH11]|nr:hypothetical protein [Xanthomonas phage RTH11]